MKFLIITPIKVQRVQCEMEGDIKLQIITKNDLLHQTMHSFEITDISRSWAKRSV